MTDLTKVNSDETRRECIDAVISRIADIEDTSSVGVIAAREIVDIVVELLGPNIYNAGIRDTKKIMQNHHADLGYEIDVLEK